jgi:hypothetical protein
MLSSYAVPDLGRLALTIAARRLDPDREKLVLERRSRTCLSAVPTTRNSGKSDEVGRERLWSMAALRLQARLTAPTGCVLKRTRLVGWRSPPRLVLRPAWGGTRAPPSHHPQPDWLEADDSSSLSSAAARSSRRRRYWSLALGASSLKFCATRLAMALLK